jgi:hypothetical protein
MCWDKNTTLNSICVSTTASYQKAKVCLGYIVAGVPAARCGRPNARLWVDIIEGEEKKGGSWMMCTA